MSVGDDYAAKEGVRTSAMAWPRRRVLLVGMCYVAITILVYVAAIGVLDHDVAIGSGMDPWQTVWGLWWWRDSWQLGGSPLFASVLWAPSGIPMWLQTYDVPSAIIALTVLRPLGVVAAYNVLVMATFPLAAVAMYALCREVGSKRWGGFIAGLVYSFSAYHFAHAQGQLHMASMEWPPLCALLVVRAVRLARIRDAVLAGATLGVTATVSPYQLLFAIVGNAVLGGWALWERPNRLRLSMVMQMVLWAGGAWVVCGGWWCLGGLHQLAGGAMIGAHDSTRFSADAMSFVIPNAVNYLSKYIPASAAWTGNRYESSAFVGLVPLGLALYATRRDRMARIAVLMACAGAVFSLGPVLHVGGVVYPGVRLPEGVLESLVPGARASGLPTRLAWFCNFGVAVASSRGCDLVMARWRGWVSCVVAVLALAEPWPLRFEHSRLPDSPVMASWASDESRWVVLDVTSWQLQLWHQMIHKHPIVGGYATRIPAEVWDRTRAVRAFAGLLPPPVGRSSTAGLSGSEVSRELADMNVRFVVAGGRLAEGLEQLGLVPEEREDGIEIFHVADRDFTGAARR